MNDEQIRRIVRETVRETLIELGLDVSTPEEVARRQADFAYLRKAREGAEDLLRRDLAVAERTVLRLICVPLADGQFDALASFTFNLGSGALQRSTLRRKVNRDEHAEVPAEFMRWVWAGGRRLKGLIRRRAAETKFYANT